MHPVSAAVQPFVATPANNLIPRIGRNSGNLAMSCKPDPAFGSETSGGDDFTVGDKDAVIIVDHGSRRQESNLMLNDFVAMFRSRTGYRIVDPAHMELAEPTIKDAFGKCVQQGASRVIVSPYFLSPGRHWKQDIPALAAEASKEHSNIPYVVTAPLGLHELMVHQRSYARLAATSSSASRLHRQTRHTTWPANHSPMQSEWKAWLHLGMSRSSSPSSNSLRRTINSSTASCSCC